MYQPQRVATAATPALVAPAFAGPRRAQRRRSEVIAARVAPTAVSLALLTTTGAFALTQRTPAAAEPATTETTLVREEATSRSAARAYAADATTANKTSTAAPATAAAVEPALAVGAWHAALGTVVGELYAQDTTPVLAKAAADATPLATLAKGQKVQVTEVTAVGFRQVSIEGKIGYVVADRLSDKDPSAPETGQDAGDGKLFWPTAGDIGSPWGMRLHPILRYKRMHGGVDIGGQTGAPIYAAADGVVTRAETGYNNGSGINVRIDHGKISGKDVETAYLHLSRFIVKPGQKVARGQVIGYLGNTGLSTAPHLHFSVYANGANVNPAAWISR